MNQLRDNLKALGLSPNHIFQQVKDAIGEDLAGGQDLTSVATITDTQVITADFTARANGVVSGLHVAAAVLEVLITAQGNTQKILLAERSALNFLSHLSGISTLTNQWVSEIAGTKCQIRDTRKTTPGLRQLEKFAVRMGGAVNHRLSLSEAALIKDNHIVAAGSISAAFNAIRKMFPGKSIEIEIDSIDQLKEVISLKPDLILLDNMSPELCAEAVSVTAGLVKLEASGGITFNNAKAYANSGVNYLAIGSLTHSAPALDIGLDFRKGK